MVLWISLIFFCHLTDFSNGALVKQKINAKFIPRIERSLPSVSNDHYQELAPDGTYRYAYTGENSYHAERRLVDGTVEGETLYVRPDGIPVKVHYFANAKSGYRPTTQVLYSEKLRQSPNPVVPRTQPVDIVGTPPSLLLVPPAEGLVTSLPIVTVESGHINARIEGNSINIGNGLQNRNTVEDLDISIPSVTAIIGPGGRAKLRPESLAVTRSGGISIANSTTTAIIGPGGSVVLFPSANAFTDGKSNRFSNPLVPPLPLEYQPPRTIWTPTDTSYRAPIIHSKFFESPTPQVLIVPSNPSYEYTYTYSAPDSKYPHKDSSAFVNVRVNQ